MHITGKSHCNTLSVGTQVGTAAFWRAPEQSSNYTHGSSQQTRCRSLTPSPPTMCNKHCFTYCPPKSQELKKLSKMLFQKSQISPLMHVPDGYRSNKRLTRIPTARFTKNVNLCRAYFTLFFIQLHPHTCSVLSPPFRLFNSSP